MNVVARRSMEHLSGMILYGAGVWWARERRPRLRRSLVPRGFVTAAEPYARVSMGASSILSLVVMALRVPLQDTPVWEVGRVPWSRNLMPPSVEHTPQLSMRQQGLISPKHIVLKICTTQGSMGADCQNDRDIYAQPRPVLAAPLTTS